MIFFRKVNLIWGIILILFFASCSILKSTGPGFDSSNNGPFLISVDNLEYSLERIHEGDPVYTSIYQKLINRSENLLDNGPFSVTYNFMTPPSGDKHDYISIAPYTWPNPNTPNGLPYVYKDGKRNPHNPSYDSDELGNLANTVWYLSLAYYFSKKEIYAKKAAELVEIWFLRPDTYMSPHLKYGQGIPGRTNGTESGIIDTISFLRIIDGVSLIYESQHWTKQNQIALKNWFYKYLDWLLSSNIGEKAEKRDNNHSTWYEAQVAAYALFTGQEQIAESRAENLVSINIKNQIDSHGRQLYELRRHNPLSYSIYNLEGIIDILTLYQKFDITITNQVSQNVKKALDWLMPFAKGRGWDYIQEKGFNRCSFIELYRRASLIYHEPAYEDIAQNLLQNGCNKETFFLVYPNRNS